MKKQAIIFLALIFLVVFIPLAVAGNVTYTMAYDNNFATNIFGIALCFIGLGIFLLKAIHDIQEVMG